MNYHQIHPPRWSEFLRNRPTANGTDGGVGISTVDHFQMVLSSKDQEYQLFLRELRKTRAERNKSQSSRWSEIRSHILSGVSPAFKDNAAQDIHKFYVAAKDIGSYSDIPTSDVSRRTDEVAVTLLFCFLSQYDEYDFKPNCPNRRLISTIKEYLGNIDPSLIIRSSQAFSSILRHIDSAEIDTLRLKTDMLRKGDNSKVNGTNGISDATEGDTTLFPFGKINLDCVAKTLNSSSEDDCPILPEKLLNVHLIHLNVISKTEEDKVQDLFRYGESFDGKMDKKPVVAKPASVPQDVVDASWDRTHLLNLVGNEDLLEAVIGTIDSDKSNDEIQELLFDLLGFDRLELIMTLLTNRNSIINQLHKNDALAQAVRNHLKNTNSTQTHPVIGVKVQSVEEKYLEKVYRKEEKKAMKRGEPGQLAYETEVQVGQAMRNKIQKATSRYTPSGYSSEFAPGDLPNVYDSYAQAKQTAGFISGVKMALPEYAIKKSTTAYEEVSIPAMKAHLPEFIAQKPLIEISSLDKDESFQKVFRGMKSLNRIQSIVFETAYRTNENLLICAPTGAGKTNIALLAVLHCIKSHMEDKVIRKDQFKIVYVAPMKALAAEMTANFSKRLAPLGVQVRELTGDMQLTKAEITQTQMLVTTPEKWDVVTRKSTGDVALTQIVKLLIIDEVHLLHGDRGPVVESLVARTLRQVESSQRMIRIVGLSATLPNYVDVARFLRVSLRVGLFYFDSRFRPVPLGQTFIGVKSLGLMEQQRQMDAVCYDKVFEKVSKGHQVMVFVHARNATVKTAENLIEQASRLGHSDVFRVKSGEEAMREYGKALKSLEKSKNKKLGDLFANGFSVHHAGLLRSDRSLIEKLFGDGLVRVLVCTATLAWGVNLPAHAVIIKGTEIYDAKQGNFVDLGILDVLQIFGRAGRPQFDTEGDGTIITTHDKLAHYLSLLTNQYPIESSFIKFLADNLNAEIALGSVTNIQEAMEWLTYTYLYVRMKRNPQLYGIQYQEACDDPLLTVKRKELIEESARNLEKAQMIRYDDRTEYLHSTDLGRTASHFYIKYDTIETFNETIAPVMAQDQILMLVSKSSEFEQIKVRDDELEELDDLTHHYCHLKVWGGSENVHGKVNILIQTYISRGQLKSFSLMSDMQYIIQNAVRICRGFFEMVLRNNNPLLAARFLEFSKMVDQQLWSDSHPLRQHKFLSPEILDKLEHKKLSIDILRETSAEDIGFLIVHQRMGATVKRCAEEFPSLEIDFSIQPITRTVLRIKLFIQPTFKWNDRFHGNVSESFWIWIEDPENNFIYHHEYFVLGKRQVLKREVQELVFTIPISEPLPTQYYVKVVSDRWLSCSNTVAVSFKHLILPVHHPPNTELQDLDPLPISALKDVQFELLYSKRFSYFNPIQTQIFHCLFHTDSNCLVGAPTGSGKTIAAELAMFRVFKHYPRTKVVYIAPLKALVRERVTDWKERLQARLGKKVVELTGDVTPDMRAIIDSDVIVTTPEKWDGISRSWQTRSYVQAVSLIIIDEIHLLGEDRGPVLEVIVSRTNYISQHTQRNLRIVGLSTALANAKDLADWLGIKGSMGLYNFRPSVRPVPIQVHIQGFPGKHYCPRMATMNKPTFQAIREHSPSKPVLVFVSSRRQTRLTALDLIAYLAAEGNPKQWLHLEEAKMDHIINGIKEPNLKLTLSFGIGIHHAGLQDHDRKNVEELFVNQKIQVLIATATLAWGVNFPAHLVVIKGTEYYDGKSHRYVDMPITDVLQMMGRAGRPQFDTSGVAVVLVHDQKKNFYKKFLYEPFPVESSLLDVMPDNLNAEIVAGTISSTQEALDYLTYTYFFRRLVQNPSYYGLESSEHSSVNQFLSKVVSNAFGVLESASCVYVHDDLRTVEPTSFGRIASYYYLSHQTMQLFRDRLGPSLSYTNLLFVLTDAFEYAQLPVRHNEDLLNEELAKSCPIEVPAGTYNSPHTKAHLLLQCHFSRVQLPSSDYYTDLKSVLDQSLRILQAMIDVCAESGWLVPTLSCINLIQMVVQARWFEDDDFMTLPFVEEADALAIIKTFQVDTLPLLQLKRKRNSAALEKCLFLTKTENFKVDMICKVLEELPVISISASAQFDGMNLNIPISSPKSNQWIDLPPGKDIALVLSVIRENRFSKDLKAFAPRFPKPKDEAWFLVLGDLEKKEVVALKRAGGIKRTSQQQLVITTPDTEGRVIYQLYLMSDCYLGLDLQYQLRFNITSSATTGKLEDDQSNLDL